MPVRPLPNDPSLEHLRKQAGRLQTAVRDGEASALALVREFHPRPEEAIARASLSDAQLTVARGYGFSSWPELERHLAAIEPFVWNLPPRPDPSSPADVFIRLGCLLYGDWHHTNPAKAGRLLAQHPELAEGDLYCAAAIGNGAAVRGMIERDPALVNAKGGPLRWAPLLYACYSRMDGARPEYSTLDVARLLLSRGADPNAGFLWAGTYAFTALTGAFGRGEDWDNQPPHPQCDALATLLLEAGADPNDSQALYNRHFQENDDHLRLLFAHGLGEDKGGPWLQRLTTHEGAVASMLTQELCWAAIHNFPERVKLLVEHGVDVNRPSPRNGRTACEEALRAGNAGIAEYLVRHGARPIELDPSETFAIACIAGRRDEVRARLDDDPALLERLGHHERVDLVHRAADAKSRDGLRLLVELGLDINGMVPGTGLDRAVLHNAAGWGGLEMVRFLLELGADPHLRDPTFHAAPIGWAQHGQQRAVVEYLMPFANIFDAVQCGGVERAGELLRNDSSIVNASDARGTPLVFYLHPGIDRLEEMVRLLIAHGADVNVRAGDGSTLLDRALARGDTEFAELLRAHGARRSGE
jgi:ankyrin repeat protein